MLCGRQTLPPPTRFWRSHPRVKLSHRLIPRPIPHTGRCSCLRVGCTLRRSSSSKFDPMDQHSSSILYFCFFDSWIARNDLALEIQWEYLSPFPHSLQTELVYPPSHQGTKHAEKGVAKLNLHWAFCHLSPPPPRASLRNGACNFCRSFLSTHFPEFACLATAPDVPMKLPKRWEIDT